MSLANHREDAPTDSKSESKHHVHIRHRRDWLVLVLLTVATLLTFSPALNCEFVNFDDDDYITENPNVQGGFSPRGFVWACTTTHASNWHPLTWLSLMLDAQLFGLKPWGYHLTNLLLHLANTLLLFGLLRRLTGAVWRSGLVAALFAVHPLHVESVVWVTERKDVLSTFFGLLAVWAYARYAQAPSLCRYLLVILNFALSLLAKPMLVTLPFVLLLLDYWPLRRWLPGGDLSVNSTASRCSPVPVAKLLLEKLPLFVLSASSCGATVWAQSRGRAFEGMTYLTFPVRLSNALVSYMQYLRQAAWPTKLAVFYPHPGSELATWQVAGAAVLMLAITVFVLWGGRRWPYLLVGWFWYLGTLLPVIGILQVGLQARADRYTYVPLIGIFLLLSWGLADLARRWSCQKQLICVCGLVLVFFMWSARTQAHYWQDSIALWNHCLQIEEGSSLVHGNLGAALLKQGKAEDAIGHLQQALLASGFRPNYSAAHNNLGLAFLHQGKLTEAARHFREALRFDPDNAEAHNNLGAILMNKGDVIDAMQHLREAVRLKPGYYEAHNNLGIVLYQQGKKAEAIRHFREAVRLKPESQEAARNLKAVLQN